LEDWLGSEEGAETGDEDEEDSEESSEDESKESPGAKRKKGPVSKSKPKKFPRMEIEYEEEIEAPQRELALA
jgi:protein MAK16